MTTDAKLGPLAENVGAKARERAALCLRVMMQEAVARKTRGEFDREKAVLEQIARWGAGAIAEEARQRLPELGKERERHSGFCRPMR